MFKNGIKKKDRNEKSYLSYMQLNEIQLCNWMKFSSEPAYGLIVISTHQQQSIAVLQEKNVQICLHFIVSGESM